MSGTELLVWLCRAVLYVALGWSVIWAYRWAARRAPVLGRILAIGIVARAALGVGLFFISFYQLPFLRGMQLAGGFWSLALDARTYFHMAESASALGVASIPGSVPSPTYVRALTLWLELVGVSPASAVLLNLVCYVLAALLIIDASASITLAAVALMALTCSPALIIFGTQALKDPMCILLIVVALAGARLWAQGLDRHAESPRKSAMLGVACLFLAVFGFAGIRPYYAFFLVVSVFAMGVVVLGSWDRPGRLKALAGYWVLLMMLWGAFMAGSGPYYPYYQSLVKAVLLDPFRTTQELDNARAGFVATGGATAVADSASDDVPSMGFEMDQAPSLSLAARVRRTIRGCFVLFVPITLLRELSIVSFTGGRGLLFVTDIDTLVMDLGILGTLLFVFWKMPVRSMPVAIFAIVLVALTTLSMAYVVTNFGTLFRLRLLAVTPLWVLPAFLRPGGASGGWPKPAALGASAWTGRWS
jgi:hypothetical protein